MPDKKRKSTRVSLASGRSEIGEVLETCEAIQRRKFSPFILDVGSSVSTLRKYFSHWKTFSDHCLDARTLDNLSDVIRLQNSQLRYQSSRLYADPKFLSDKFRSLLIDDLARILLKSWHPIVELEQLAITTVREALRYWEALLPYDLRRKRLDATGALEPSELGSETLKKLGIAAQEAFSESLERLWQEMKNSADQNGQVRYYEFIERGNYEETTIRAYFVSFLVTYGYATLKSQDNSLILVPYLHRRNLDLGRLVSFPISLKPRKGGKP